MSCARGQGGLRGILRQPNTHAICASWIPSRLCGRLACPAGPGVGAPAPADGLTRIGFAWTTNDPPGTEQSHPEHRRDAKGDLRKAARRGPHSPKVGLDSRPVTQGRPGEPSASALDGQPRPRPYDYEPLAILPAPRVASSLVIRCGPGRKTTCARALVAVYISFSESCRRSTAAVVASCQASLTWIWWPG